MRIKIKDKEGKKESRKEIKNWNAKYDEKERDQRERERERERIYIIKTK
jgi:hypothetical protein